MTSNITIKVMGSVILPAALYGCEIWSFTCTEGCMLRIVENVAIEEYFEHRQEKLEGWKQLYCPLRVFVT
jgi:hypothetical protein